MTGLGIIILVFVVAINVNMVYLFEFMMTHAIYIDDKQIFVVKETFFTGFANASTFIGVFRLFGTFVALWLLQSREIKVDYSIKVIEFLTLWKIIHLCLNCVHQRSYPSPAHGGGGEMPPPGRFCALHATFFKLEI